MSGPIYLDNNATTAIAPQVQAAVVDALSSVGNATSLHSNGRAAAAAVDRARAAVAAMLRASPGEVLFTSGATEANNLAIAGLAYGSAGERRRRIVTCATEHAAVLEPVRALAWQGFDVVVVPVDELGVPDDHALYEAVDETALLVSVMSVNNETGVQPDLSALVDHAHDVGAMVHTDATQLAAWGGLDTDMLPVDLLSVSAHKMHGMQGVGALFVRREAQRLIRPLALGGGQERGLRSGTLNVAGLVSFGVAADLAVTEGAKAASRVKALRDQLYTGLAAKVDGLVLNGHPMMRAPSTLNVSVPGIDAEAVVVSSARVALSTGSACHAGVPGPSHVLAAMGLDDERINGAMRLSLSRFTTEEDIATAVDELAAVIEQVRERQLVGS